MRMGRSTTGVPTDCCESNEEARAALRRVVRATRADLADMDRLLDRAERLVSGAFAGEQSGCCCRGEPQGQLRRASTGSPEAD